MSKVSAKGLRQRQLAPRKHGTRAFQARGVKSLTVVERSRLAEILEATQTRETTLQLMQERASAAVLLAEMAESWLKAQADQGIPFDKMTLLNRITTFQESSRRHLAQLYIMLPEAERARDITEVLTGKTK